MKETNSHNSNNFPDDLKYSDENWEMALQGIEKHEKSVLRKRSYWILSILGIIAMLVFSILEFSKASSTQNAKNIKNHTEKQVERFTSIEKQTPANRTSNPLTQKVEEQIISEKSSNSIIENFDQDSIENETTTKSNNGTRDTFNQKTKEPVTTTKSNSHTTDINVRENKEQLSFNNPKINSFAEVPNKVQDQLEIGNPLKDKASNENDQFSDNNNNFEKTFPPHVKNNNRENVLLLAINNTDQSSTLLKPLLPRQSLRIPIDVQPKWNDYFSLEPKNNKKKFLIPYDAFSARISVSPWVNYGKNNYWSGINPSMGVEYENNGINKIFNWSLGVNYFTLSELPLAIDREETTLNYGYESIITSVKTDQLHFVSVPLTGSIRIRPRVQLGVGFGFSYLITANNTLTETKETNFESELLNTESTYGYIQGFNRSTYYTLIRGDYWLTQKLCMGANYQFGLSDFSINKEFEDEVNHSNSKLEINLKYRIR